MAVTKGFIEKAMAGKVKWESDDSVSKMIEVSVQLKFSKLGVSYEIYDLDGELVRKDAPLHVANGDTLELAPFYFKLGIR